MLASLLWRGDNRDRYWGRVGSVESRETRVTGCRCCPIAWWKETSDASCRKEGVTLLSNGETKCGGREEVSAHMVGYDSAIMKWVKGEGDCQQSVAQEWAVTEQGQSSPEPRGESDCLHESRGSEGSNGVNNYSISSSILTLWLRVKDGRWACLPDFWKSVTHQQECSHQIAFASYFMFRSDRSRLGHLAL